MSKDRSGLENGVTRLDERKGGVTRGGFLPSAGEVALTFTGLDVTLCSGPIARRRLLSHWPVYPHGNRGPVKFKDFSFFGFNRRRRAEDAATGSSFKIKKNSGSRPTAPLQDIDSSQLADFLLEGEVVYSSLRL